MPTNTSWSVQGLWISVKNLMVPSKFLLVCNRLFKAGLLYSFVKCISQCLLCEIWSSYSDGGEWRFCLVGCDAVPIGEFFLHFRTFEGGGRDLGWNGMNCVPLNMVSYSRRLECFFCFYMVYISNYWLFYGKADTKLSKFYSGYKPSGNSERHIFSTVFYRNL
jgi:hypothetical protein